MLVESIQKTEPRRKVQELEPVNPELLEQALDQAYEEIQSGKSADVRAMGYGWLER